VCCALKKKKKKKFLLKWASRLTSRPTRESARPAPCTRPCPAHTLRPRSPDREQSFVAAWPPLAVDGVRVSPGGPGSCARLAITPRPGLHSLLLSIFSSSLPSSLEKPSGSSHRRTPSLHPPASNSATAPPFFDSICLWLRLDLRHPVRPLLPSFSLW
jgi:hypothetical protein